LEPFAQRFYRSQTRIRGRTSPEALKSFFEKMARWYACRLDGALPADRNAPGLDLACGYGNFLYFLDRQGYRNVRGVDSDREQVHLAQALGLPAEEGRAQDALRAHRGSLGFISALDFFEHLSKDEAFTLLDDAYAALRPGGRLILRMPCADGPLGSHDVFNDVTHQWGATSGCMAGIMGALGFDLLAILDERPQPYTLFHRFRLAAFHVARAAARLMVLALGLPQPVVWSTSMWIVARRPIETSRS
jgi:SAM-dependent methyltransferase